MEWISTKDRKPDKAGFYWAYDPSRSEEWYKLSMFKIDNTRYAQVWGEHREIFWMGPITPPEAPAGELNKCLRNVGYDAIRFVGKEKSGCCNTYLRLFQYSFNKFVLFEDMTNNRYIDYSFSCYDTVQHVLNVLRKKCPSCNWEVTL